MSGKKFLFTLALIVTAVLTACSGDEQAAGRNWQNDEQIPVVEAVEVMYGSLPLEERLSGSVRADNQTEIYAEVSGTIEQVHVDNGDQVKAGEPLVHLRARDFEERVRQAQSGLQVADARVRQADASLTRTQADLKRIESLVERGLGTLTELDTARAEAISAEADLELMKAQRNLAASVVEERQAELADTIIKAPIDGVVGNRNAEIGQQANTSTALFTIGDISNMQIDIILTQKMLAYIDIGTPVNIYTDTSPDEQIAAKVNRISPYLHPVTHTTEAEIKVDESNGMLRPGMFVTVDVLYGQSEQAPLIPNSALYSHPRTGREGVFVTSMEQAPKDPEDPAYTRFNPAIYNKPTGPVPVRFVPIEVVARGRMSSGVRGINQGDWVITMGHNLLSRGDVKQVIVQPTPWDHILDLQQMQSRDLLNIIRSKQQQNGDINLQPN